jgi:segregation and condensation protein B
MSLKAKVEAIIYATEEPVTLDHLASLLRDEVLTELRAEEEARLALNEIISDGPAPAESDELADDTAFDETPAPAEAPRNTPAETPRNFEPAPLSEKDKKAEAKEELKLIKAQVSSILNELVAEYASSERGMEIRQIAGGYRMATKPEHHDVVVNFAKSLKPPVRLSLQALETLAVIAYKQPVTVPEISEIRGVDTSGVIATLLDRKLVTTAGRKQVIGRPILYKTTKEFLLRFGLNDVSELPSMEEFEKLGDPQADLFAAAGTEKAEPSAERTLEVSGADESEPVTEAVPEDSNANPLVCDSAMPADGTYATEAEGGSSPEKP